MADRGARAWFVFIGIQILQVIVFMIPGEVTQAAGGFIFGAFPGVLLSSVGILVGSVCNYAVGKFLGKPFVQGVVGADRTGRFLELMGKGKVLAGFFLLFLIPGIPKDALCYIAGISGIGLVPFMVLSGLGRLPGIMGSAIIGGAAANRNWVLAAVVFSVSMAFFFFGLIFRKRLEELVRRIVSKRNRRDRHEERSDT